MRYSIILILILTIEYINAFRASNQYVKYVNILDPQAKCLDGSPPAMYIHQGKEKNKFLIHFRQGSMCGSQSLSQTLEACFQRSKTFLGTSTLWPETLNTDNIGYLDTDPNNSKFSQWTKIYFPYCDGSIHQGFAKQPISYKGSLLYFRGAAIVRSHFQYLNIKYGLFSAQKIVLSGASAGGLATFFWNNYLRSKLPNPNIMVSIADSGIFNDFQSKYTNGKRYPLILLQNLFKVANKDQNVPVQGCMQAYPKQGWRCLFFENLHQHLQGKFLIINSGYDSYELNYFLNHTCVSEGSIVKTLINCPVDVMTQIQKYRENFNKMMENYINKTKNSVWSISCSEHILATGLGYYNNPSLKVPQQNGYTLKQAVEKYVFQNQRILNLQLQAWPNNSPCAY